MRFWLNYRRVINKIMGLQQSHGNGVTIAILVYMCKAGNHQLKF